MELVGLGILLGLLWLCLWSIDLEDRL